jgi:uncharacterized protein YuzE
MERLKKITTVTLSSLLIFFMWVLFQDDRTSTRQFCAYGEIYVEFEHNGKIWGTTFLNEDGKPIICNEDTIEKRTSVNKKEVI